MRMLRIAPILSIMTKDDAIKLREARRARVRMLRSRVVGGSVALFLAVWSLIAVVLITGHDPALAKKTVAVSRAADTSTAAATGATTTAPTTTTSSSNATSSRSSGATSSTTGSSSSSGSSVTSSQS
jgi:uncharacterized membrane protein YgcG